MGIVGSEVKQAKVSEKGVTEKDVAIERRGSVIVLPEAMTYDEGIKWLERRKEEEERIVAVNERVDAYPLDAAFALSKALARKFGFTSLVPTPGFFGDKPPNMLGVEVSLGVTAQVAWGRMQVPGLEGWIGPNVTIKDGRPILAIVGEVKRKHEAVVAEIAKLTRQIVREESIYRGKAIRVRFPDPDEFDPSDGPKFMDISQVRESDLIFPAEVQRLVQTALFTPVERTAQCRRYKIPLKRGVLLEGPYGTGKTLTAYVAAKKCVENGWTYIYLETVSDLASAIQFAKQYSPAMIFAEDIDQVIGGEERDDAVNAILNTIDGVEAKDCEIITVLSTNHVERINPAMLRPGRLDAVVPVRPPDREAVVRLLGLYGRGLIAAKEDLGLVADKLSGHIPATIREVVERAKLAAVGRLDDGEEMVLLGVDLLTAADGMLAHLALMQPKAKDQRSPAEKFGHVLGQNIVEGVSKVMQTKALVPQA